MVMARIGMKGSGRVMSPPNSPTRTSLPPLVRLSTASFAVLDAPTKSIAAQTPFSAAAVTCLTASLAAPSIAASAPARSAASRLAGSVSTTMAPLPPIALRRPRHIRPSPPAPITTTGSSLSTGPIRFSAPNAVRPEQA